MQEKNKNNTINSLSIQKLLEKMYIKRFCIPSTIDIHSYNNKYLCNNFNHVSCFLYWTFTWLEDG